MARLAGLLILLATVAQAAEPDHLCAKPDAKLSWTAPPYLATLPQGVYADPKYRVERRVGTGPWATLSDVAGTSISVAFIPCQIQQFRAGAVWSDGTVTYSDPSETGAFCMGDVDTDRNGVINATDFSWFRTYYMRRLEAGEWVR